MKMLSKIILAFSALCLASSQALPVLPAGAQQVPRTRRALVADAVATTHAAEDTSTRTRNPLPTTSTALFTTSSPSTTPIFLNLRQFAEAIVKEGKAHGAGENLADYNFRTWNPVLQAYDSDYDKETHDLRVKMDQSIKEQEFQKKYDAQKDAEAAQTKAYAEAMAARVGPFDKAAHGNVGLFHPERRSELPKDSFTPDGKEPERKDALKAATFKRATGMHGLAALPKEVEWAFAKNFFAGRIGRWEGVHNTAEHATDEKVAEKMHKKIDHEKDIALEVLSNKKGSHSWKKLADSVIKPNHRRRRARGEVQARQLVDADTSFASRAEKLQAYAAHNGWMLDQANGKAVVEEFEKLAGDDSRDSKFELVKRKNGQMCTRRGGVVQCIDLADLADSAEYVARDQ